MGMYTEINFRAQLMPEEELPDEVLAVLLFLVGDGDKPSESDLPVHPLFETDRWQVLGRMTSAYFPTHFTSFLSGIGMTKNSYDIPVLGLCADLKNYDDEIGKFFDWINPYLAENVGTYIGYSLYEEATVPTLHYVQAPAVPGVVPPGAAAVPVLPATLFGEAASPNGVVYRVGDTVKHRGVTAPVEGTVTAAWTDRKGNGSIVIEFSDGSGGLSVDTSDPLLSKRVDTLPVTLPPTVVSKYAVGDHVEYLSGGKMEPGVVRALAGHNAKGDAYLHIKFQRFAVEQAIPHDDPNLHKTGASVGAQTAPGYKVGDRVRYNDKPHGDRFGEVTRVLPGATILELKFDGASGPARIPMSSPGLHLDTW